MYTLKGSSEFIRTLYQHQCPKDLKLKIPAEIVPYTNNLISLLNTPPQLLIEQQHWINNTGWTYMQKTNKLFYYYDENDPDLMIEPIDDTKYRKTLANCFEAYLRRQLILLYSHPDYKDIKNIILEKFLIPLPTINPFTNNPDDIRFHQAEVKLFSLRGGNYTTDRIPTAYRHFKWYFKNREEQPPNFRCRPALLNTMDCMTMLHDNMSIPSLEMMIKTSYFLRPFRFVLPLSFLYDIFGGFKNTPPIEYDFPAAKKNNFPDETVLSDRIERDFLDKFKKGSKRLFGENEVISPRRANIFLAGGSVSYMIGLTNEFNDLDLYIEYDLEVFTYITCMTINTTTIESPFTTIKARLWVIENEYNYDDSDSDSDDNISVLKHKIPKNKNIISYAPPDPKIIFQNKNSSLIQIHSVYNLNPKLSIVKHWQMKYKHLPQIIFIKNELKLDEYNILKMITGFDLAICRNALSFKHAKAFHLRNPVLEKLYGYKQINDVSNVINFVNAWENDEEVEFLRKMSKIEAFEEISPKERKIEYHNKRLLLKNDAVQKSRYIKQQRKMLLIKWPYDSCPMIGEKKEKTEERHKRYLKRLPIRIVDFKNKITLPMEIYPLKYLAYWEFQKNVTSINHNCLCNLN